MALITARRSLATLLEKTLSSSSSSSSSFSTLCSRSRFAVPLLEKFSSIRTGLSSCYIATRLKTSGSGYSPLNDPSPNWSNRPPKETILLDGCDYEHWLIVMEFTDPKPTEDEMINAYVKTLTSVVGRHNPSSFAFIFLLLISFVHLEFDEFVLYSEEEAKKKIYSVCTSTYTGFGALISEELSYKVKGLPGVLWVLPDSYLDVPNKDYGGDLYIEGKVIPRPQYRFTEQRQTRNRSRPRYDKRRETMQVERREPTQNWSQNQPPPSTGQQAPATNLGELNKRSA